MCYLVFICWNYCSTMTCYIFHGLEVLSQDTVTYIFSYTCLLDGNILLFHFQSSFCYLQCLHCCRMTAVDKWQSLPALPVSCIYSLIVLGGPICIILRIDGMSTPIPIAIVANTTLIFEFGDVSSLKICSFFFVVCGG